MTAPLSFAELKGAVSEGSIDTVLACMVDMQGRLVGKRFQAEYFVDSAHEETHACNYLLANDIDMEPVPGYKAASWNQGYGDFVLKPDMDTLRRIPWLEGTALVLCDVVDHHHHDQPHSPRAILKKTDRATARTRLGGDVRLRAGVLPVRRKLRRSARPRLPQPENRGLLRRGLPHPANHPRRSR